MASHSCVLFDSLDLGIHTAWTWRGDCQSATVSGTVEHVVTSL